MTRLVCAARRSALFRRTGPQWLELSLMNLCGPCIGYDRHRIVAHLAWAPAVRVGGKSARGALTRLRGKLGNPKIQNDVDVYIWQLRRPMWGPSGSERGSTNCRDVTVPSTRSHLRLIRVYATYLC